MAMILSIGCDNLATLSDVQNAQTLAYLNAATVTGSVLVASTRVAVAGSAFTLSYVAATTGVYQGFIPLAIANTLTQGTNYIVEVVVTAGGATTTIDAKLPANYYTGG